MLILNFTYPLRCLRVPPVEYHWIRPSHYRRRWEDNIKVDLKRFGSYINGSEPNVVMGYREQCNEHSGCIKGREGICEKLGQYYDIT